MQREQLLFVLDPSMMSFSFLFCYNMNFEKLYFMGNICVTVYVLYIYTTVQCGMRC